MYLPARSPVSLQLSPEPGISRLLIMAWQTFLAVATRSARFEEGFPHNRRTMVVTEAGNVLSMAEPRALTEPAMANGLGIMPVLVQGVKMLPTASPTAPPRPLIRDSQPGSLFSKMRTASALVTKLGMRV